MRFQKQAFRHNPEAGIYGDCNRTVLACMLGLDRDEVPHWHEEVGGEEFGRRMDAFLDQHGVVRIAVPVAAETTVDDILEFASACSKGLPYLLAGKSRNDTNHVVIGLDREIVWDPALDDSGIVGPCSDGFFWVEWLVRPIEAVSK